MLNVSLPLFTAESISDVSFTVQQTENCSIKYIKEVKCIGEKPACECAISVYIPTPGEDLWGLAKRLNVAPETLVETNKELRFPLTGDERIVIYRKK